MKIATASGKGGTTLVVRNLDAFNGTPVLDIKVSMVSLKRSTGQDERDQYDILYSFLVEQEVVHENSTDHNACFAGYCSERVCQADRYMQGSAGSCLYHATT